MDRLEKKLGYSFHDKSLLKTALTHSSYANERSSPDCRCYERLEFLGDSILGLTAAEYLYAYEPPLPEGRMTKLRARLVCEESLHAVALRLGIGEYMILSHGEERSGGRQRASILADMVEAIIAAIYLDSGMAEAKRFIMTNVLNDVQITMESRPTDYKSQLQELVQRRADQHISYEQTGEEGPDHCKTFRFAVLINGEKYGEGSGRTKKEAEQLAAKRALELLQNGWREKA